MVPKVLAIGLDPRFADFSAMPDLTPELIRAYIDAEMSRVRELGFEVDMRLIAPEDGAEEIEQALGTDSFACILIGAGLREPSEHLLLFEKILNLVHRLAPATPIAFNSTPADSAEAVRRWAVPQTEEA
jgi:hypothetical protein